jgi:hypothetical protein
VGREGNMAVGELSSLYQVEDMRDHPSVEYVL